MPAGDRRPQAEPAPILVAVLLHRKAADLEVLLSILQPTRHRYALAVGAAESRLELDLHRDWARERLATVAEVVRLHAIGAGQRAADGVDLRTVALREVVAYVAAATRARLAV